jgi:hypothetical protein
MVGVPRRYFARHADTSRLSELAARLIYFIFKIAKKILNICGIVITLHRCRPAAPPPCSGSLGQVCDGTAYTCNDTVIAGCIITTKAKNN